MMSGKVRYDLASDNTAGVCPAVLSALHNANHDAANSYGEDEATKRLCDRIRDLFEIDCDVFVVFNGTAANGLALSQLCRSFQSVICHEHAHIENDECGAVEFFTGGAKLIPTAGPNGKLDLGEVETALVRQHDLHSHKPRVLSITQATEMGTIYAIDEVKRISVFAKKRGMTLHMDGARFANAMAKLECPAKEITWRAGVDVLCFGGTKNGLAAGELVIFFDKKESIEFDYRLKQAGQLSSKMRFFSAQWLSLLENDAWLTNARHANQSARNLADKLRRAGAEVVYPVEANAVFCRLKPDIVTRLTAQGWNFFKFIEPDIYRLMCAWSTEDAALTEFVADFADSCAGEAAA